MTERSEEWDNIEKNSDDYTLPPKIEKAMVKARNLFLAHSDTCLTVNVIILDNGTIEKLYCESCGWNYVKKSWKFWK